MIEYLMRIKNGTERKKTNKDLLALTAIQLGEWILLLASVLTGAELLKRFWC